MPLVLSSLIWLVDSLNERSEATHDYFTGMVDEEIKSACVYLYMCSSERVHVCQMCEWVGEQGPSESLLACQQGRSIRENFFWESCYQSGTADGVWNAQSCITRKPH